MRKVSNPMTETIENTANLPYKNPELPTEERIADLLGRMTLEEKVGQMMQLGRSNRQQACWFHSAHLTLRPAESRGNGEHQNPSRHSAGDR